MQQKIRPEIRLHFGNNVYTADTRDRITITQGIYVAYPGKYNPAIGYVELGEPIYIGMADDTTFADRIADHAQKQHDDWKARHCDPGQDIYYRVAELTHDIRSTEAAMIFTHKPPCNLDDKDHYNGTRPVPNVHTDNGLDVNGYLCGIKSIIAANNSKKK